MSDAEGARHIVHFKAQEWCRFLWTFTAHTRASAVTVIQYSPGRPMALVCYLSLPGVQVSALQITIPSAEEYPTFLAILDLLTDDLLAFTDSDLLDHSR